MNKKEKRARMGHSYISRQILMQYVLTVAGFIAGVILLYILMWQLCRLFIWQADEPLYVILKFLQDTNLFWGSVLLASGILFITYRFISKPLGYLDEVVAASEQLARRSADVIVLSPPMKSVQDELNLAREQALRDAAAAKDAEQRKNDLIVYLAHDLKTPLTSIIGYLTLLRDEPQISPEMRAKYTGIALEKAERLEDLINEFFDITRFNLTGLTLNEEVVNLTRMLEQTIYEFHPILAEKALTWSTQLAPDVQIVCDPDKLQRVFDNLLRNAVNYSYRERNIVVSLVQNGEQAEIQVKNYGKAIPSEKLEQIFEQFFRLDSSRDSSTGGAGLGLAIAKEIVELHGGTIAAESADEAVTFTVTLPLSRRYI